MKQSNLIKSYEPMKDKQGYFKSGQRQAIYNAALNDRDKLLIRLLWKTGRRIGEILQIVVKDIDLVEGKILWHIEKKTVKVGEKVKNGIKKAIRKKYDYRTWKPIDNITLKLLKEYIERNNLSIERNLFYSIQKPLRPITRQRAFQIIRKCCDKANVLMVGTKRPHPHHFRHSLAIDMAKSINTPSGIRLIQQNLEHSDITMTSNYLQFGNEELRSVLNSLEDNK